MKKQLIIFLVFFNFSGFAQNNPPVAVDDTIVVYNGLETNINVRNNDFDIDGNGILIDTVFGAINGSVQNWFYALVRYSRSHFKLASSW